MRRVVLDPNVLVSALISPAGVPARVIEAVLDGELDHVVSPQWLAEANGLATRPRFRRWFTQADAEAIIERLWLIGEVVPDPARAAAAYTRRRTRPRLRLRRDRHRRQAPPRDGGMASRRNPTPGSRWPRVEVTRPVPSCHRFGGRRWSGAGRGCQASPPRLV